MELTVTLQADYQILSFVLGDDPISADDLKNLVIPDIDFKKGVVIDGRGPIWLHSFLAHHCHPAAWVAHNDPRLGAVVVQSHVKGIAAGDVIA